MQALEGTKDKVEAKTIGFTMLTVNSFMIGATSGYFWSLAMHLTTQMPASFGESDSIVIL